METTKIKVKHLTGKLLEWAVLKVLSLTEKELYEPYLSKQSFTLLQKDGFCLYLSNRDHFNSIAVVNHITTIFEKGKWISWKGPSRGYNVFPSESHETSGLRCFVYESVGEEIEVPLDLLTEIPYELVQEVANTALTLGYEESLDLGILVDAFYEHGMQLVVFLEDEETHPVIIQVENEALSMISLKAA